MKNIKMDLGFGANFSWFFAWLLLTNNWASDENIFGAYTRGCKEEFEKIFKKIAYKHIADVH